MAQATSLTPDAQRLSAALEAAPVRVAGLAAPLDGTAAGFSAIRIHGDFHLGQTLKTPTGFVLVDFEGEPARPVEERRQKHCALKDVAGMLRSFEYAFAVAGQQASSHAAAALRAAVPLREAFLEGYFAGVDRSPAAFVPRHEGARAAWLSFFELEKAVYEVEYELNNRPTWVHIPLEGLVRILGSPHSAQGPGVQP
jgi:trehalose synthase-fused probable maltokinase